VSFALVVWASPPVALVSGVLFSMTIGHPWRHLNQRITKGLLQASVVLLGFGMDLPTILRLGVRGSLFSAATIALAIGAGWLLGRILNLSKTTSLLVSAGTAICGGSAIAAVSVAIAASEAEIAISIGTIFLLNAAALYLFPLVGHLLHLSQTQFGIWAGLAIHDISSVVGAGLSYGPKALAIATAVKLSRTLWIAPLTLALAFSRSQHQAGEIHPQGRVSIPWFVFAFLLASFLRGWVPAIANYSAQFGGIAHRGMILTLFLVGTSLSLESLRALGWRALSAALAIWALISLLTLYAVKVFPQLTGLS